jgi:phosphoserine phosphatase
MEREDVSTGGSHTAVSTTPLSLWNDGPAKTAILDFVERVTTPGKDFLPRARRIAAFDNDGTLWCEQPLQVQFFFGHQRLEALVRKDPELKQRQPFKAYLERDMEAIKRLGKQGLFEVGATAFAGSTEDEFDAEARSWLASARHPKLGARFIDLTYEPQLELLEYLRANGFKIFIVTGGGIDLVRALAEDAYGIPPEQVIGSSVKTGFELRDGLGVLVKQAEIDSFDDREVKVHSIGLHIGRRPILCFGNSDGDLAMLRYTLTGDGPRLGLLLHHDDAEREFAYDREFHASPLADALDHADAYGIRLVSMKHDWRTVFASDARLSAA